MKEPEKAILCYMNITKAQFKNVDLNFDINYHFHLEVEKLVAGEKAILRAEKKRNVLINNFWGENISSVNVLAGSNGSGKTSILHTIIHNIRRGLTAMNGEKIVYIVNVDGKYIVDHNYSCFDVEEEIIKKVDIEIIDREDYFEQFRKIEEYRGEYTNKHFWNNIIFYSNYFGYRYSLNDSNYIVNVSKDKEISRIFNESVDINGVHDSSFIQKTYHKEQYKKILSFMFDPEFKQLAVELDIQLPELIIFSWNENKFEEIIKEMPKIQLKREKFNEEWINYKRLEKHLIKAGRYIDGSKSNYESAINKFSIFMIYKIYKEKIISEDYVQSFIEKLSETEELTGVEILYEILEGLQLQSSRFNGWMELVSLLNNKHNWWILRWQDTDSFVVKWEEKDLEIIRKQFNIADTNFYNCDLGSNEGKGQFSSGEEARVNFLVSMYEALQQVKKFKNNNNRLLLLLDEVDVYYHPQLQISMVDEILRTVSLVFKEYQVQIIFSTNTPLELSDIPNHNIIYLDKGVVLEKIGELATFGGNICTLLKNNFFINSSMGVFAKKKINQVIEFLNNPSTSQIGKEEVKYIISIIAEPIIKEKLENWYNQEYPEDVLDIKLKEEIYQQKIMELETYIKKSKMVDESILDKLQGDLQELSLLIGKIKKV